ncbi:MAG: sulfotransferase [Parafilimonas sp.]
MHPNFLIIGPPKCASTSLHFYLGQHPDVYTSKVKETVFFSRDYYKGMQFYENYFKEANGAIAIGEATPVYAFLPFVADRIKQHYPDAKLILCFRNPMDRAFSSWLMQKGMGVEKASFRDAMEMNLKQLNYVTLEGEEGAKTWLNSIGNFSADESRLRTYLQAGLYSDIIKNYQKRFNPAQIKVIFLEDLKNNFDSTMKDLFHFLNVDENFEVPNKEVANFYFERKGNKISNKIIGIKGTRFIAKRIPKSVKNIFKKKWKAEEIPKISNEDRVWLWEIFKNDIAQLEKLAGRDLSAWNPKEIIQVY